MDDIIRYTPLCHGMTQVFKGATQEDAVVVRAQERPAHMEVYSFVFHEAMWEDVEKTYNPRDWAMADALHTMGAYWGPNYYIPAQEVGKYLDDPETHPLYASTGT